MILTCVYLSQIIRKHVCESFLTRKDINQSAWRQKQAGPEISEGETKDIIFFNYKVTA